jgi:hypothetical protein
VFHGNLPFYGVKSSVLQQKTPGFHLFSSVFRKKRKTPERSEIKAQRKKKVQKGPSF